MRKFALLSASALVLALGVASASAQPSGQQFLIRGETGAVANYGSTGALNEGRAAAIEAPTLLDQHHAAGH